jgi:hypothetical protein
MKDIFKYFLIGVGIALIEFIILFAFVCFMLSEYELI